MWPWWGRELRKQKPVSRSLTILGLLYICRYVLPPPLCPPPDQTTTLATLLSPPRLPLSPTDHFCPSPTFKQTIFINIDLLQTPSQTLFPKHPLPEPNEPNRIGPPLARFSSQKLPTIINDPHQQLPPLNNAPPSSAPSLIYHTPSTYRRPWSNPPYPPPMPTQENFVPIPL